MRTEVSSYLLQFVAVSEKQKFIIDFWHQRSKYTQKYYYSVSMGVLSFLPPGHNH